MKPVEILLLSLFASAACGGPPEPEPEPGEVESDIVGGRLDRSRQAVGRVGRDWPTAWICTGTLIAPDAVLTAAHCLFDERGQRVPAGRFVFHDGLEELEVESTGTSRYSPGAESGWNDIAILHLSRPSAVPPLAFATEPPRVGAAVTVVGFGVTRATGPHTGTGGGSRRSASVRVASLEPRELVYDGSERGACYGDSGGPVLARVGGAARVVGVTSRVSRADCRGLDVATRVDVFAPWIARSLR